MKTVMLKLCYLVEWDVTKDSGVLTKIINQTNGLRANGAEVLLVIVSPNLDTKRSSALYLSVTKPFIIVECPRWTRILSKIAKGIAYAKVGEIIKDFSPDIVYWRESSYTPGLTALMKRWKFVFEVNANVATEYKLASRAYRAIVLPQHRYLRGYAAGFVAVTSEICRDLSKYHVPSTAITNGYDLRAQDPANEKAKEERGRMSLVFVGSPDQQWHGLDRLIEIARVLPEIDFDIVGPDPLDAPSNTRFLGYLTGQNLHKVYRQAAAGIGTLALERKGLVEACPLKTREYLAFGLPVIGAYRDPDLQSFSGFLQLDFRQDLPTIAQQVRSFLEYWKDRTISMYEVDQRIGVDGKERARLQFFHEVAQRAPVSSI